MFTPTLSPQSSLHTDATGLCKVSFHTPLGVEKTGIEIFGMKGLYLFVCGCGKKATVLVLCCFVAFDLKPLSFPQHMDVAGDAVQTLLHMSHCEWKK